jgi:hypothetical protein
VVVVVLWLGSVPPEEPGCDDGVLAGLAATTAIDADPPDESIVNGASAFPEPLAR